MSTDKQKPASSSCIACGLRFRGISATRIILWLGAITLVSFAIGFCILALSGNFPPTPGHDLTPFRQGSTLVPNTTTVPLDGATVGDVQLTLGAGDLTLQGSAPDDALMEATIFSQAAEWQPELVQTTNASRKFVTLIEKGHKGKEWFAVDSPNRWDIDLNNKIPLRLDVTVGAGDTLVSLGSLNLESLAVHTGAGDTTVDLGGYHGGRFDAVIKNGVGDLTLRIPKDSNTRIQVHNGIGDISDDHGLVQHDDTYMTDGFNTSLAVNEITLNQGVGSISLETV
ncbi:toast rack family protein [Methanoregula sp.]|uniref:toast rack family protein n=1 Tax=Methanoregula sp. TaxID=2052170 RepID=UPI00236C46D2|nr:toast rack family protein [Methanoregula sp.]MDD1687395.1 toast rack family protein [Methanoregula sp.]